MAELNRQLQEYLAQSKSGRGGGPSGSLSGGPSTALDLGELSGDSEDPPVSGSWFGRWSSPFRRQESPGNTAASAWPWSSEPDPCLGGLSRTQRLSAFGLLSSFSLLCFALSALYAPLLLLYARKFALLWSLGSLFAIGAVAVLRGPVKLLYGVPHSPPALAYLTALGGTLYAALSLQSTVLTAIGAGVQVCVIVGAVLSLLPGGSAGMRFVGGLAASAIKRTVRGGAMSV